MVEPVSSSEAALSVDFLVTVLALLRIGFKIGWTLLLRTGDCALTALKDRSGESWRIWALKYWRTFSLSG